MFLVILIELAGIYRLLLLESGPSYSRIEETVFVFASLRVDHKVIRDDSVCISRDIDEQLAYLF